MNPVTQQTSWSEVKQTIKALNPSFHDQVESVKPGDDLALSVVHYPYGHVIPKAPLALILEKQVEQYIDRISQPVPWNILSPGDFFSTELNLATEGNQGLYLSNAITTISGIKDIHLLSLHGNTQDFYQLRRKYDIPADMSPSNPLHHFNIFKHLIEKEAIDWHTSILVFDDAWKTNIEQNPHWWPLKKYLMEQTMKANEALRFTPFLDFAIQDIAHNLNLKLKPFVLDNLKQCLLIATGQTPGFRPITTNEGFPIQAISEALNNASRELLSDIVFMQTAMSNPTDFIYHSITYNSATSNESKFNPNTLLNDINLHLKDYLPQLKQHALTQHSIYGTLSEHLEIIPCSTRGSDKFNIKKCIEMYELDPSFSYSRDTLGYCSRYGAPINAQFCKGFFGMRKI